MRRIRKVFAVGLMLGAGLSAAYGGIGAAREAVTLKPADTAVAKLEAALLTAAPTLRPQALHAALSAWESLILRGQAIRAVLTVIDYSLPSTSRRMWVFDLASQKLLFHELVSHGRNSGEDMAEFFSNEEGTLMTSLGAFVTGTTYTGKNGYSLRLRGMDPGINDQAAARTLVVHGAPYVSDDFAHRFGRLGRSHGCPAVRTEIARELIDLVKEQSLLYAWHPSLDSPEPPPAIASTTAHPPTRPSLQPAP
jgi:hypothetical protein